MNRYLMIRRLWWPVMLVLTGVLALLHQMGVASFSRMWPLYLIFWGALLLAERAAINNADLPPYPEPMGGPYAEPFAGQGAGVGPYAGQTPVQTGSTAIVPAHGDEITYRDSNGGSNGGGQL